MLFYPHYKNMLKEIGRKNGENWIMKEAMSRGYRCFWTILCWSHYLMFLPIHKMLLLGYEEDIKQISTRALIIIIFLAIFVGGQYSKIDLFTDTAAILN